MYIRIYKEKKSSTQSYSPGDKWILEVIPSVQNSFRGEFMSWNGSYYTTKHIKLKFDSYESATSYAQSHGMEITDKSKEEVNKKRKKNYLDNF